MSIASLLSSLNPSQRSAVEYPQGALLIIAGAGSGKTRVITTRIAWLIEVHQALPDSIVALTFTNKAAKEMKERVEKVLSHEQIGTERPAIGTFHGYCLQLLKSYGYLIDLPNFSIMDSDDQTSIVNKILKKNNLEKQLSAKTVLNHISAYKNSLGVKTHHNKLINELSEAYEKEKEMSRSLDFDDLLLKTYQLFASNKDFKNNFQQRVAHILVDEYQDTNVLQDALLKHMTLNDKGNLAIESLCVVGDEDQSIYSWRGATVSNILEFSTTFSDTKIIKIEQNYRSDQKILNLANHVINHNKKRNPKTLWSGKQSSYHIAILSLLSNYQEADTIAQAIKLAKEKQLGSIAILYRSHYQSRALEESLIKSSIAYSMVGGIQFYERKEIKDLLAYLKLLANPFDRLAASRILNCPPRGLGPKCEEALLELWAMHPFADFFYIAQLMITKESIQGKRGEAFKEFVHLLQVLNKDNSPVVLLEYIIQKTAYYSYLQEYYDKVEAEGKIENIKELLRGVAHFVEQGFSLDQFLHEVALMQDKNKEQHEIQPVMLMSCHAAKGLEFDFVVVCGLEEGTLPLARSSNSEEEVEEERRLFYVGVTRARQFLLITYVRYRYQYGSMSEQKKSRFIKELPDQLAQYYDISNSSIYQIQAILQGWLNAQSLSTPSNTFLFKTFGL